MKGCNCSLRPGSVSVQRGAYRFQHGRGWGAEQSLSLIVREEGERAGLVRLCLCSACVCVHVRCSCQTMCVQCAVASAVVCGWWITFCVRGMYLTEE